MTAMHRTTRTHPVRLESLTYVHDGRARAVSQKLPSAALRQILTIDDGTPAEVP
jgi:hypothetical protein